MHRNITNNSLLLPPCSNERRPQGITRYVYHFNLKSPLLSSGLKAPCAHAQAAQAAQAVQPGPCRPDRPEGRSSERFGQRPQKPGKDKVVLRSGAQALSPGLAPLSRTLQPQIGTKRSDSCQCVRHGSERQRQWQGWHASAKVVSASPPNAAPARNELRGSGVSRTHSDSLHLSRSSCGRDTTPFKLTRA